MTIASLIAFAAFTHIVADVDLSEPVKTGLKWSSLAAACFLVFAVQLGVQTLPFLLSGKFTTTFVMCDVMCFKSDIVCPYTNLNFH